MLLLKHSFTVTLTIEVKRSISFDQDQSELVFAINPSLIISLFLTKGEVARTKERLWQIMNSPGSFVDKSRPIDANNCGSDCWEGCDDFKTTGPHDYCVHCDDTDCTADSCQCCRGWCDTPISVLAPSAAKFVRLAFHQCLK